ncbi:hypothetical protein GE061_019432 [Apolygus lucorum]|uniref:CCDC81 HU domain-containing protein n=1 Tax=Apolygus lucorum TaxID=248454 RepID=A0A6A4J6V6_APOLU|nr:hypothetical protein GE061_019432 [Apolygus lucorum]
MVNVFDQIKNNPMTVLGAKYTAGDIRNVWKQISIQIIHSLKDGKGVVIKGLGTFTLSNWSLETGNNNRTLDVWRPVFLISRALMEDFDLHQPKQYANDAIPLAPISYHQIADVCRLSKEAVTGCIQETTQCLRKVISDRNNVNFPLHPLGSLAVFDTKVVFTFHEPWQPRCQETPTYCAKFPPAITAYEKKSQVPCPGHAGPKF